MVTQTQLPLAGATETQTVKTQWYTATGDGRILCQLCPRACRLKPGDRGFCFVRKNVANKMELDTYGKSTGFCIDPIEKKPLNHFLPGTPVLSFGTAGCNLGCKFCQNWDISKSREVARLSDSALPQDIAAAAQKTGCRSVAYTYNDPVIWAEYAIDTAVACREIGIRSVAVTAGYITPEARGDFFSAMDAANIDLKAFTEDFYFKLTGAHLQPVLDTIEFVCNETDCWVELTNLIIPRENDGLEEVKRMCGWILDHVGPNVPIHFTAFHPDFRMTDRARTDQRLLEMAYDIARQSGLNYVYVGNVHDVARQSTYCHGCGALLIQRDWHQLGTYALNGNQCAACGEVIPGRFESHPGTWGARRQPIRIQPVAPTPSKTNGEERKMITTDFTQLDQSQQSTIRRAASAMVQAAVEGTDANAAIAILEDLADMPIDGVFVTVKRGETLRGCCGRQGAAMKLGEALVDSSIRTSRDPRMTPLSAIELPYLSLSVSLLGPPRPIGLAGDQRENAIEIGKHGLRIQMGTHGGLLLPQVAVEQGWTAPQFLDGVCRKAGLPAGTWRSDDCNLMLFDGIHFDGEFELGQQSQVPEHRLLAQQELASCRDWVAGNLASLQIGATPMYYAMGVSDLEILGLVLTLRHPAVGTQQWLQLSLKDYRPMQSSLYQMTEQATQWLAGRAAASECEIDLAIFADCVHHGMADQADLRGIAGHSRALVLTDGRRWSVQYSRAGVDAKTIEAARSAERFRGPVQLYSVHCECTTNRVAVSIGPRGDTRITSRDPAVAGTFYKADDASREEEVDALLEDLQPVGKRPAVAVMVPHARASLQRTSCRRSLAADRDSSACSDHRSQTHTRRRGLGGCSTRLLAAWGDRIDCR